MLNLGRRFTWRTRPSVGWRQWLARVLIVVVLASIGVLLGLRLAGSVTRQTALGSISLRVEPSFRGQLEAFIPIVDWGVRADAFSGPVKLHIEPRDANRGALLAAASGDKQVLGRAERDARDAARAAFLRALAFAIGAALALGMVAAGVRYASGVRTIRTLLGWVFAPAALAVAISGAALLRVQSTFDPQALQDPSFYARGAELDQLLKVAGDAQNHSSAQSPGNGYTSSVYQAISAYASLLSAGGRLAPPPIKAQPSILMSDLHDNQLVLPAIKRLFSGRAILFPGDFGNRGTRDEARVLVPQITALSKPVIAVSGNHDSSLFMQALAKAGAIVLTQHGRLAADGHTDGQPVQKIDQMSIAGYADPLEWKGSDPGDPTRIFSFAQLPDHERRYAEAQAKLVAWFRALTPQPQVVLVHENGLAQALARAVQPRTSATPLLILTGHDHKQHVDRYGHVLVVDAGTVGAGGFFGVGHEAAGLSELRIAPGKTLPQAIDLINVFPLSGAETADRVVPSSQAFCQRADVHCHPAGA